jgi:hypothetical protein
MLGIIGWKKHRKIVIELRKPKEHHAKSDLVES